MHDPRCVLCKLGTGGLRQNTTDFTKFITLMTFWPLWAILRSQKHKRKTVYSVQT